MESTPDLSSVHSLSAPDDSLPPPPPPSLQKQPSDPGDAARRIQELYRKHQFVNTVEQLETASPKQWSNALNSVRLSLIRQHDQTISNFSTRRAWRRATVLAGMLGKGSAGAPEDQSLTLLTEHWLEATDQKHRYGSNLKLYHDAWQASDTTEPFFFWLDHGQGKNYSDAERPRSRLEAERVTYLTPAQRRDHVVIVQDGLLVYKQSGAPVHTLSADSTAEEALPEAHPEDTDEQRKLKKKLRNKSKFIYVTDGLGNMYVGRKIKGGFHHSSFLGGGSVCSAGGLVVDNGQLVKINPNSGHYRPESLHFEHLIQTLKSQGVNFGNVKVTNKFAERGVLSADYPD